MACLVSPETPMKDEIAVRKFRVDPGDKVKLKQWPTAVGHFYKTKEQYAALLQAQVEELSKLQGVLYAHNSYAILLILQAMDAAGKDGVIKHVMSGINPQGCQVFSFKQPSSEELDHDFLWRSARRLPERGRIGIFNRSYYEEVLVVRVHPDLLQKQNLPDECLEEDAVWKGRYRSILDFEGHLHRNGTRVVKIYLHLSKDEQRKRLLSRVEQPEKNWKASLLDIEERGLWKDYMRAYEACLTATSTQDSPWFIVPADDKENARLIVAEVMLATMRSLQMSYPRVTKEHRRELQVMRRLLRD